MKQLEEAQDSAREIGKQHNADIKNIRDHCEDVLRYMFWKVHLDPESCKIVMDMFARIFGKKPKDPPPPRVMQPLHEFEWRVAKQYAKFLCPSNIDDTNQNVQICARVRPRSDAEMANEEMRELSYTLDSTGRIISFGDFDNA